MKVLLLEDDSLLGGILYRNLADNGYVVVWFRDGEITDEALLTQSFDIVLLDMGLPKRVGLSVLRRLRARGNTVPVILLSESTTVSDRVVGLDSGADAYLLKPFAMGELEARIRALTRPRSSQINASKTYGSLLVNSAKNEVWFNGKLVLLTRREYQLLEILVRRPDVIFTRSQLENELYDGKVILESNAVKATICRLRQKIDRTLIKTVRGIGYQLDAR